MAGKRKIMIVFGTRPEVIKLAPVIAELKKYAAKVDCKICVTGQHREMVDPLLKLFKISPDYDLNLMLEDQSLEHVTTTVLKAMGKIFEKERPDYLMVQGDTTTAMAAGLAAFYKKVKVAHLEAGLRTWDAQHPFPEEVNRRIIDSLSELYFSHTESAKRNLLNEGIDAKKIEVTGNTVIDALLDTAKRKYDLEDLSLNGVLRGRKKLILVTAHRRENFGQPILQICNAIKTLAREYKGKLIFVYPVHLNPNVFEYVHRRLDGVDNVFLTRPLEYLPFVKLMARADLVLTDSGGLQEEAPSLGKPVLVMRETTERPEGVQAGCVKVIGTDTQRIIKEVTDLLENREKYRRMAKAKNPYGDGTAARKTVKRLMKEMGI